MSGLVFRVPHASTAFPPGERERLIVEDQELADELHRLTDADTDRLFFSVMGEGDMALVFLWSRLLVDVERFRDPGQEPMAARGLGAVYELTIHGRQLRPEGFDPEPHLNAYYDRHHRELAAAMARMLADHGRAVIIDCHSFPSCPLPCDLDQNPERSRICLGTDPYHTPAWLVQSLEEAFTRRGLRCSRNAPYAGTMVPLEYLGRDRRVISVMIELRRDLYMDELSGELGDDEAMKACLSGAIEGLRSVDEENRLLTYW